MSIFLLPKELFIIIYRYVKLRKLINTSKYFIREIPIELKTDSLKITRFNFFPRVYDMSKYLLISIFDDKRTDFLENISLISKKFIIRTNFSFLTDFSLLYSVTFYETCFNFDLSLIKNCKIVNLFFNGNNCFLNKESLNEIDGKLYLFYCSNVDFLVYPNKIKEILLEETMINNTDFLKNVKKINLKGCSSRSKVLENLNCEDLTVNSNCFNVLKNFKECKNLKIVSSVDIEIENFEKLKTLSNINFDIKIKNISDEVEKILIFENKLLIDILDKSNNFVKNFNFGSISCLDFNGIIENFILILEELNPVKIQKICYTSVTDNRSEGSLYSINFLKFCNLKNVSFYGVNDLNIYLNTECKLCMDDCKNICFYTTYYERSSVGPFFSSVHIVDCKLLNTLSYFKNSKKIIIENSKFLEESSYDCENKIFMNRLFYLTIRGPLSQVNLMNFFDSLIVLKIINCDTLYYINFIKKCKCLRFVTIENCELIFDYLPLCNIENVTIICRNLFRYFNKEDSLYFTCDTFTINCNILSRNRVKNMFENVRNIIFLD